MKKFVDRLDTTLSLSPCSKSTLKTLQAKLTMVGSPSGGEFPNSIAINDQGEMACVLNAGRVNGVKYVAYYLSLDFEDLHTAVATNHI
jgi:hypothetical protein